MKTQNASARDFPLAPLPRFAWLWLWAPILLAIGVAVGVVLLPQRQGTPVQALFVVPLVVLIAIGLSLALRRRRIGIDGGELAIAATFYSRRIPVDALDLDKARIIDLAEHTQYKPALKTNGFNLPGFKAGHYRLRNHGKAFCLLTDLERVLVLPQRDGRFILLSPEKPQALLDALRRLAEAASRR